MPEWKTSPLPVRSGLYQNFTAAVQGAITAGASGTVVVIGCADWGPLEVPTQVSSEGEVNDAFWSQTTGSLRETALEALAGTDGGGASVVQMYRMSASENGAVAAVAQLNDSEGHAALLLKGRYKGSRPNKWVVNVTTNTANPSAKNIQILEGGQPIETIEGVIQDDRKIVTTGATTAESKLVTNIPTTSGMVDGMTVTGAGISAATTIAAVLSASEIELSAAATATAEAVVLTAEIAAVAATNDAFAEAINAAGSQYVVAETTGTTGRVLANVNGVVGGKGGFGTGSGEHGVLGASGQEGITQGDYANALRAVEGLNIDCVTIAGVSDQTTQATFVAWLKSLNENVQRAFGIIGGPEGDTVATSAARSRGYNCRDLVNVGATTLRSVVSGETRAPYQQLGRVAGAIASVGLRRSTTNLRFSEWQVLAPPSNAGYEELIGAGVWAWTNDTPTRVRVEKGITTFTVPGEDDPKEAHRLIENVAIDHFVNKTLTSEAMREDIGRLKQTETGRNTYIGEVLDFLRSLENLEVIASGASTVSLDTTHQSVGASLFVNTEYGYVETVERVFMTSRVKAA